MSQEPSTSLIKDDPLWKILWTGWLVVVLFFIVRGCLPSFDDNPIAEDEKESVEPTWDVVLARRLHSVSNSIVVKDGPFDKHGDASLTRVERIVTPKQRHEWYDKITWKIVFPSGEVVELDRWYRRVGAGWLPKHPYPYSQTFIEKLFIKEEFDMLYAKSKKQGNKLGEHDYERFRVLIQDGPRLPSTVP